MFHVACWHYLEPVAETRPAVTADSLTAFPTQNEADAYVELLKEHECGLVRVYDDGGGRTFVKISGFVRQSDGTYLPE